MPTFRQVHNIINEQLITLTYEEFISTKKHNFGNVIMIPNDRINDYMINTLSKYIDQGTLFVPSYVNYDGTDPILTKQKMRKFRKELSKLPYPNIF